MSAQKKADRRDARVGPENHPERPGRGMTRSYQGRTLAGDAVEVTVEGAVIASVLPIRSARVLPLIAPPLVDLQQNGALGHAFVDLDQDPAGLAVVAAHVRRHGVGRMLATFTTHPLQRAQASLVEFNRQLSATPDLERLYSGIFYEGNYMSPLEGWRGMHDPTLMREPRLSEWSALQEAAGGRIRVFNIAPELPRAIETIREAVRHGLRVSMGHCCPDADTIRRAVDAGADLVTHLGNGAPAMLPRHQNPFWTWLADERVKIGLIADGFHLPADFLRAAIAAKGRDKVYLVSDASGHSGMPPGDYGQFHIEANGRCRLKGTELLAGAWYQADRCVEHMCELGWPLADAWRQQSVIPARIFGLTLPELTAGEPAEFVLASWQPQEGLRLEQVVALGRELLDAPVHPKTI
ncbi:MAG: N-acetylglucosamine-6-phosphate deacetylase [Lacunisphaera sp.]|nr:N-acetylglucosamine-6-phosphate deacetylase [Lacunisphaera sp.]